MVQKCLHKKLRWSKQTGRPIDKIAEQYVPTADYINRVARYIPYRAKCMEKLREQLFPEEHKRRTAGLPTSILSTDSQTKKSIANVEAQKHLIVSKALFPLALADSSGLPIKGQKSNTTKSFKARYKDATPKVFLNALPDMWVPGCVIVEGMFMLNTTPLSSHRTFADYANFLNRRYVLPNFAKGAKEVHILFDNPGRLPQTPKSFERKRRDLQATVIVGHVCDAIEDSRYIPSKWREDIVDCRNCKRILVLYLAKYYMKNLPTQLQPGKKLVLAGCFDGHREDTAWLIT